MKKRWCGLMSLLLALALLAGCGGAGSSSLGVGEVPESAAAAQEDYEVIYRGVYAGQPQTLNYLDTMATAELGLLANCVDSLLEYDSYGNVRPGLAERWAHNDSWTVWSFTLRRGAPWVDAAGKVQGNVTAQDFVDAALYVNDAANDAPGRYLYDMVQNANEWFEQTKLVNAAKQAVQTGEAETEEDWYAANRIRTNRFLTEEDFGVKAIDTYVVEFTLAYPCPYFESVVCTAPYLPVQGDFLRSKGEEFGRGSANILYNGAFVLDGFKADEGYTLLRNKNYWDAGKVYIDRMEWMYDADARENAPELFLNGEIDYAAIGHEILNDWMADDVTKDWLHSSRPDVSYSYFYCFNFEPRFAAEYEPENWSLAVNNENFRKAIAAAIDKGKALAAQDPFTPQQLVSGTITPAGFATAGGLDFTGYDPLLPYTENGLYNEELARQYRDEARQELEAEGCTFPIKVLMPYNPESHNNWGRECELLKEQLEAALGGDFIEIIPQEGPETGFLDEVRRSGKYAFMKCNFGADYADPQTYTEPFTEGASYNFMHTDEERLLGGQPCTGKTRATQQLVAEYAGLLAKAVAEVYEPGRRYLYFAGAEAFLIEHALAVPFSVESDGYVAEMLNPFDGQYAPHGLAAYRYKGRRMQVLPMSGTQYTMEYSAWMEKRANGAVQQDEEEDGSASQ